MEYEYVNEEALEALERRARERRKNGPVRVRRMTLAEILANPPKSKAEIRRAGKFDR